MKSQTIASRGINQDTIESTGADRVGGVLDKDLQVHLGAESLLGQELVRLIKNGSLDKMNLI